MYLPVRLSRIPLGDRGDEVTRQWDFDEGFVSENQFLLLNGCIVEQGTKLDPQGVHKGIPSTPPLRSKATPSEK